MDRAKKSWWQIESETGKQTDTENVFIHGYFQWTVG